MNNRIRALTKNGQVVVEALDSTEIVRRMEEIHKTSAVSSAALGRLLTAASLMGCRLKNPQDSLTLRVDGGGPIGVLVAVSDGKGNVRGYATRPVVELPLRQDGKLDVGAAVGTEGTLSVIKDMGLKEPYIGQTPLVSGEIADDITAYYAQSEQTPTVCALGVLVDKDLHILCAGGYLLQLLPGTEEETIQKVEKNVAAMPPVTDFLSEGGRPRQMMEKLLAGMEYSIVEENRTEYRCYCSREKTMDILYSLGSGELEKMREEEETAQVECHFCGKKYIFNLDELSKDMERAKQHA